MNIETGAIDALGASLKIADDVLNVFEELGKIPKQIPVLGTLAGLSEVLSAGLNFADGTKGWEVVGEISDALSGVCTTVAALAPPTAAVAEGFGALFDTASLASKIFSGEFTSGLDIASGVLEGLGIIASAVGVILLTFVGTVPALIAGIVAGLFTLASAIVGNWESICEFFSGIWTSISEGFSACWDAIVLFFTETIPTALAPLMELFAAFGEFWAGIWEQISTFFSTCWDAIVLFFTETIPLAVQSVMDFFAGFGEFLSGLWQSVGAFFSACWDAIVLFFTETLPGAIDTAVNFFSELPGKIWEFLSQAVDKLGEWASGLISKAGEVLPGVISSVLGFFSGLPDNMREVGKNLIEGIFNGISNSVQWLYEKLRGWAGNVIDYIKGLFEINSPSKVMRDTVGVGIAEGVAVGILDNTDLVSDAMSEMADVVTDSDLRIEPEVSAKSIDFEAFKEKIRPSLDFVKSQISKAQDVLHTQFAASMQLAGAMAGANNTYNNGNTFHNHYTITSANHSPKATADAIKNQMTMQRMLFATR